MGPQHLVIAGPSSDEDQYSMALYHPGNTGTAGDWKKPGDLVHMRETFKDLAQPMRKVLDAVDSSVVWKVVEVPPLPSWISTGGNVVIIGDAAHGMMPYQGQVSACTNVKSWVKGILFRAQQWASKMGLLWRKHSSVPPTRKTSSEFSQPLKKSVSRALS
jgi:hypothetical protein